MKLRWLIIATKMLALVLTLQFLLQAQAKSVQTIPTPHAFVEDFYDWYVSYITSKEPMPSWGVALKYKKSVFAPPLARLLAQDRAAQGRCQELVGLDFDPFLNTQDPADHYSVGEVVKNGQYAIVSIYSVRSGEKSRKPSVRAKVSAVNGHYSFINFLYPDARDLITLLKLPKLQCSAPATTSLK